MPNAELRKALRIIAVMFSVILLLGYAANVRMKDGFLRDRDGYAVGIDFVNMWMMGRAALTEEAPERNYDIPTYNEKLTAMLGEEYRVHQWSYPPHYMLLAALPALLPYTAALFLFWAASIAALLAALRLFMGRGWRADALAILAAPAAFIGFISGQVTLLAVALQLAFFHQLDKRPLLAGVLLGVLSLKPQLGLIYPFFLIATRRWRTFIAAAVTTLSIVALTYAIWGEGPWRGYIALGIPMQSEFVLYKMSQTVQAMMPTLFVDLRVAGLGDDMAMDLQILAALFAIAVLFTPAFRRLGSSAQMLAVASGSVLVTPYLMTYDTLFLAAATMLYLREHAVSRRAAWLLAATFWLPILHFVAIVMGIPGTALLPLAVLVWLLRRAPKFL